MKLQTAKSHPLFNRLAIAFVALALALAALQQFRPARATALSALATAATPPTPKTDFDIYPLNSTGVVQAKSGGASWLGNVPGYNITRVFKNSNNQSYVIMLNGNTGRGRTYALDSDGSLGAAGWETGNDVLSELRCTSAETVKIGATTYLLTHDSFTGTVRTFHLYDNGQPNLGTMTATTLSDWKDKNLFSLYYYSGAYYLLGVDTWTGNAVAYSINGQKIGEADWSRGWTSVDHLAVGGVTYRLLYKAAGDPHKAPGEANDQLGRFVIQTVNANGVSGQNIYDAPLGAGFSAVRFAPLHNGQNWVWHVFFFKRDTAHYLVRQFDNQNGVGAIKAFGVIKDGPNFDDVAPAYVDIEPYTIGVNTFLATVSDDNAEPFYFDEVERMGLAIHDALQGNAVGYQFMVAQSGRLIYSRAGGLSRLSSGPLPPNSPLPMTTRTQHSLGSVSKMITSMTILRLVDQGKIDLYAPVSNYLPASDYPLACNMQNGQDLPECWVKRIKVIDLLKHTSGVTKAKAGCSAKDGEFEDITPPQVDCKNFFSAIQDSLPCDPVNGCKWSYNNSNVSALRKIIEYVINAEKGAGTVESSQDIVRETRLLWADNDKVRLGAMTCQYGPYVYYYGPCEGAGDCYGLNGKSWLQYQPSPLWDEGCSAGGWSASSREMIEFLFAIRYRHIFSSANNAWLSDLLLSAELKDSTDEPGSTALAWGVPWTAEQGGEKNLGKDGLVSSHGVGLSTYITRLPNNCDAVILVNTGPGNAESLLKGAYNYGKGITNILPNY